MYRRRYGPTDGVLVMDGDTIGLTIVCDELQAVCRLFGNIPTAKPI